MSTRIESSPRAAERLELAHRWLAAQKPSEQVLIVATTADPATEVSLQALGRHRATFGWHRTTLARLALSLAAPALADKNLAPAGALTVEAVVTRVVNGLGAEDSLGRYTPVADRPGKHPAAGSVVATVAPPGFPRLLAPGDPPHPILSANSPWSSRRPAGS